MGGHYVTVLLLEPPFYVIRDICVLLKRLLLCQNLSCYFFDFLYSIHSTMSASQEPSSSTSETPSPKVSTSDEQHTLASHLYASGDDSNVGTTLLLDESVTVPSNGSVVTTQKEAECVGPSGDSHVPFDDTASVKSDCSSVASSKRSAIPKYTKFATKSATSTSGTSASSSRISRPCAGHEKPTLPVTPPKFGSMDALWETHSHRGLSEAGLSRHADHTVLTEDTDSFIIGQKVWVGGTKPGKIAYIGETQFAPGEWAGIVLDQSIGKNDGSVAGVRYFQCEPKHGVFSRLTRLTSVPLPGADLGDTSYTFTPPSPTNNNTRRSPMSPTGSTKGLYKSQPFNVSSASLSSPSHVDFKIGDRVIIKSSQGSKVGVVRYMGTTEFAPGEWCGVELDEPRGKNDGSVEGKRYFTCRPLYGLFAPLSKVSKSPLKYKPGNCVIHSSTGLKKAGSRESMTSMNSSMNTPSSASMSTRTALQDVLREKQQHIEQLLKERDLERAEVNRAASQADEVEQKLATLQSEYEKYRSECELKWKEFSGLISTLNVDKNDLQSQLEEEKRKNEDILFRFEETAITKGDIEKSVLAQTVENERNKTKIKELENKLKTEHQKVENLEADSQKLFETEEALVSTRDELENLKKEIENLKSERLEEKNKLLSKDDEINNLKNLLEVASQETYKITKTQEDELNQKLKEQENEVERHKRQIKETEDNCLLQTNEIKELKEELMRTKKTLEEKSSELEKVTIERNEQQKEIEQLKMKLSSVLLDVEKMNDEVKQNESSFKTLQRDYDTSVIILKAKEDEIVRHKKHAQEMEKDLKGEIERLRNSLQNTAAEKEKSDHQNELMSSKKDKLLEEVSETLEISKREAETLKNTLEELKQKAEKDEEEANSRHKREIEDKSEAIATLTFELQKQKDELVQSTFIVSKLEGELRKKDEIVTKLQYELDTVKNQYQMQMESQSTFGNEIKGLQAENLDLRRNAEINQETINRLTEDKRRLESEIQTIISSSGEYSVKLQQITNEMLEKDRRLEMLSNEYKERIQEYENIGNGLKVQLQEAQEESERIKQHFELQLQKAQECEYNLRKQWDEAMSQNKTVTDGFLTQLTEAKSVLSDKELALGRYMNEAEERERQLKTQLEQLNKELRNVIESCNTKLGESEVETVKLKGELGAKSEQISELELKVKLCQLEAEQRSENMQKDYESLLKKKDFDLDQTKVALSTLQSELKLVKNDCNSHNTDLDEKNSQISALTEEITQLRHLVEKLQIEKDNLLTSITDSKEKFVINSQQCADLMEQVTDLTKKANLADKLSEELNLQQAKLSQFVRLLDISEERKQKALTELQAAIEANGENEKCKHILDIVKNFQATSIDSDTKKISNLRNLLEEANHQLNIKGKQLEQQQNEITKLENQLLQMQQLSPPGSVSSTGQTLVSLVPTLQPNTVFTPNSINAAPIFNTNPRYYSKIPSQILVPLVTAKNITLKIFSNLVFSHKKTNGLLNEIRYAIQTNNMPLLLTILRNYPTNFLNADDKKLISLYLSKVNKGMLSIYVQLKHQSNVIQYLLTHIKNAENMYDRLPVQCKLHASDVNLNQPDKLADFLETKIQKLNAIIKDKTNRIQELQDFAFKMYNSRINPYSICTFKKPQGDFCANENYICVPKTNCTSQEISGTHLYKNGIPENSSKFDDSGSTSNIPRKCPHVRTIYITVPKIIPNHCSHTTKPELPKRPSLYSKQNPLPKIIYIPVPQKPRVVIKEVVVPVPVGSNNESIKYHLLPKEKDIVGKPSLPPPLVINKCPPSSPWISPKVVVKKIFIPVLPRKDYTQNGLLHNLDYNTDFDSNKNKFLGVTPFDSFKPITPHMTTLHEKNKCPLTKTVYIPIPKLIHKQCSTLRTPRVVIKIVQVPCSKDSKRPNLLSFKQQPFTRPVFVPVLQRPIVIVKKVFLTSPPGVSTNSLDNQLQLTNANQMKKNTPYLSFISKYLTPTSNKYPTQRCPDVKTIFVPSASVKCPQVKTVYVPVPKNNCQKCPSIPTTYYHQPQMFEKYSLPNVAHSPKVIIKVVPVRMPHSLQHSNRPNLKECKQFTKKIYIPVPQRPKVIIKKVPVVLQPGIKINSDQSQLGSKTLDVTLRPKPLPTIVINKSPYGETPKNLKIPTRTIIIPKLANNRISKQKCPFVKPVFISVPYCKKTASEGLSKNINLPYRYIQLPPRVLVKKVMVPVILPRRTVYRNCPKGANLFNLMPGSKNNSNLGIIPTVPPPKSTISHLLSRICPATKTVYIPITKFVRNKCQQPLQPNFDINQSELTPRSPKVIIKVVPIRVPDVRHCIKPIPKTKWRPPVKTIFVPVSQRPIFIIKKVPVTILPGLKDALFGNQAHPKLESSKIKPKIFAPPPVVLNKYSYPKTAFPKCPTKTIIVPMSQSIKNRCPILKCPISKPVYVFVPSSKLKSNKPSEYNDKNQPTEFIRKPPKVIVKKIAVPVVVPRKVIYKECQKLRNYKGGISNINDNIYPKVGIGSPSYLSKPTNPNTLFSNSPNRCPKVKTVYIPIQRVVHHNCAISPKTKYLTKPGSSVKPIPGNNKPFKVLNSPKVVVKIVPIRVPYIPKNLLKRIDRRPCAKTRTVFVAVPQRPNIVFKTPVGTHTKFPNTGWQPKVSIPPPIVGNKYSPHKTPVNSIISPLLNLANGNGNVLKQKCPSVKPIFIPVSHCKKPVMGTLTTDRKHSQCTQMPPRIIVRKMFIPIVPFRTTPKSLNGGFNLPNSFKPRNVHISHSFLPKKCPNVKTVYVPVPKLIQSKCKSPNYLFMPRSSQPSHSKFHITTEIPPSPKIIVKVVPVRVPYATQMKVSPSLEECKHRPIVKTVFVPVSQRPRVIVKEVPVGSSLGLCRGLIGNQLDLKKQRTFMPPPVIVNKYPSSKLIKFPRIPTKTIIIPQKKVNKECPVQKYPTKKVIFVPVPFCKGLKSGPPKPESVKNYPTQIIHLPPKVLVKKVPIFVTLPRKIVYRECSLQSKKNGKTGPMNNNTHPFAPFLSYLPFKSRTPSVQNQKCSAVRTVYVPVLKFIRNKCTFTPKPNYFIKPNFSQSHPSDIHGLSGVSDSPKVIIKLVPVRMPFSTQGTVRPNLIECKHRPIIKTVFVPVSQRPKIIVKKVPIAVTSNSCTGLTKNQLYPKVNRKDQLKMSAPYLNGIRGNFSPKILKFSKLPMKTVFVPIIKYIKNKCPVQQCPIGKPTFFFPKTEKQPLHIIRLPPRVIIKKIAVPVIQPNRVVYKECKTQLAVDSLKKKDKYPSLHFTRPNFIFKPTFTGTTPSLFNRCPVTKTVYIPIPKVIHGKCTKSPKFIIKVPPSIRIPYLSQDTVRPSLKKFFNRPIIKRIFVPVPQRPKIIIKQVPVTSSTGLCVGLNKNALLPDYNNVKKMKTSLPFQFFTNKYLYPKSVKYPKILTRTIIVPKTKLVFRKCPVPKQSPGKLIFVPVPFCKNSFKTHKSNACSAPQIIRQPPTVIVKKVPVFITSPRKVVHKECKFPSNKNAEKSIIDDTTPYYSHALRFPQTQKCPTTKTVYVPVTKFIRNKCTIPSIYNRLIKPIFSQPHHLNRLSGASYTPKIFVKVVPVRVPYSTQRIVRPNLLECKHRPVTRTVFVPVFQRPKIIVKKVPVLSRSCESSSPIITNEYQPSKAFPKLPIGVTTPIMKHTANKIPIQFIRLPPKVIIKKVPVPIIYPPKIVYKKCNIPSNANAKLNNGNNYNRHNVHFGLPLFPHTPQTLPLLSSNKCPLTKTVYVPYPKLIRNKCFVVPQSNNAIRNGSIHPLLSGNSKQRPPKVIIKTVPVKVPCSTQGIARPNLLECKHRPLTRTVFVPVFRRPKIIVKKVPVLSQSCENSSPIITNEYQPSKAFKFPKLPIGVTTPIMKHTANKIPVQFIRLPPKIIIKKVPVPIIYPSKIVNKKCNIPSNTNAKLNNGNNYKHHNGHFGLPLFPHTPQKLSLLSSNKCPLTKTVYVPYPKLIRNKCFVVPQSNNAIRNGSIKPLRSGTCEQHPPKVIIKTVPVRVPYSSQSIVPPNLLECKHRPLTRTVFVPVFRRPKIIVKKVPVASQSCENSSPIITNEYQPSKAFKFPKFPIGATTPIMKHTANKIPVQFIRLPPKIIIKKVPVPIIYPSKIVYKKCNIPSNTNAKLNNGNNYKHHNGHFGLPLFPHTPQKLSLLSSNKCPLTKTVYIPYPKLIRNKCFVVPQSNNAIRNGSIQPLRSGTSKQPPPKVIIKTVPVKVPFSTQGIARPNLLECKHTPVTRTVFVPVFQRPKVIVKKVPVFSRSCENSSPIITNEYQPSKAFKFPKFPIGATTPIMKHTANKIPVQFIRLPPKIIIKKVPVPIIYPSKIVYKKCNIPSNTNAKLNNGNNYKHHNGHFGLPLFSYNPTAPHTSLSNKCPSTKTVYVPYPKLIRNKCIEIPRPNNDIRYDFTQPLRNTICKQLPPKVVIKTIPIRVPYLSHYLKHPSLPECKKRIVTKTVFVPVPQRPKTILKEIPVFMNKLYPKQSLISRPVNSMPAPIILNKCLSKENIKSPKIPTKTIILTIPKIESSKSLSSKCPTVKPILIPVPYCQRLHQASKPSYSQNVRLPPRLLVQKVYIPIFPSKENCIKIHSRPTPQENTVKGFLKPFNQIASILPHKLESIHNKCPVKTVYIPVSKLIRNKCVNYPPKFYTSPPNFNLFRPQKSFSPAKVIIKVVPVRLPCYQSLKLPKFVNSKHRSNAGTLPLFVNQQPKIIVKHVPRTIFVPIQNQRCSNVKPVFIHHILKAPKKESCKCTTSNNQPVRVIQLPPKVIVKKISVPVILPRKLIYKKCPTLPLLNAKNYPAVGLTPHPFSFNVKPSPFSPLIQNCPKSKIVYISVPKLIHRKYLTYPKKKHFKLPSLIPNLKLQIPSSISHSPPKVVIKLIPVRVPYAFPDYKRQNSAECKKGRLTKTVFVPVPQRPKVIIKQVPILIHPYTSKMSVGNQHPKKAIESQPPPIIIKNIRPSAGIKFPKLPTKVIIVPKLVKEYLWKKCPRTKPIYISVPFCKETSKLLNSKPFNNIQVPPRVIVKKVAVPIVFPQKVIYKECNLQRGNNVRVALNGKKQPGVYFIPQFSQYKPQFSKCPIIKTVYIPLPKLIRSKCITPPNLTMPSFSHLRIPKVYKPHEIPHSPKVIIKLVPIRVPSPTQIIKTKCLNQPNLRIMSPKVVIQRRPIYIPVPKIIHKKCFMPAKSTEIHQPFPHFTNNRQHPVTKIIYVPIPQRPRIIIKKIVVPVQPKLNIGLSKGQVRPHQQTLVNLLRKPIPSKIINKCRSDSNVNRPRIKYVQLPPKVVSKIIHIPVVYPCKKVHKNYHPVVTFKNKPESGILSYNVKKGPLNNLKPPVKVVYVPVPKIIRTKCPHCDVHPHYSPRDKKINIQKQPKVIPFRVNVLPTQLSRNSVPLSSHPLQHCRFVLEKQKGQIALLKRLLNGEIKKSNKHCSCDSRPSFSKILYPSMQKENRCTSPKIIYKLLPIIKPAKTVIKEVRLPFSSKCPPQPILLHRVPVPPVADVIEKEKIVHLPPKVVIKTVFVPIVNASKCPLPKLLLQKVFIPLPSRIIIKEVPVHHPPRIVIKEVPVIKPLPLSQPSVNLYSKGSVSKPKIVYKKIPILQPPRTIIKEVPITLPPRIVYRPIVRSRKKCNSTVSKFSHFGSILSHISRIESSLELHKRIIEYQKTEISNLELEIVKLLKDIISCSSYATESTEKSLTNYYTTRSGIIYKPHRPLMTRDECIKKLHKNENIVLHLRKKLKDAKKGTIANFLINHRLLPNYKRINENKLSDFKFDSAPLRNILPTLKLGFGTSKRTHPSLFLHGFATTPRVNNQNSHSRSSLACVPKESLNEIYTAYTHIQTALTHCMNSALITNFKQNGSSGRYGNDDRDQLIEEKKLAESQIDFLNSIIVDMQKKNAEQKAKIEILETGYSPAAADELNLMGLPQHKRPPRAYCDICEEFDLHETEDCPLQATENHPSIDRKISPRKAPPPPRPYCEICEIFGHCTEDCKDDQTY
ncbi:uncharacterized protein LOC108744493 isoform X5 [Agrilus planipennis]|uniref:Uncharacterized protein LOC108744493 isoform X5 n=1 Tax=Agrilus planipennis TaxID=224129 RepID=A0A7F5R209_AGRPL|nr:uncharacterized protein LOC108744493 isoform X5 [Agrilus planipennis]